MSKKIACKSFNTNNKSYDAYLKLQTVSTELSEMILKQKDDYHCQLSDKLRDPRTSAKAHWSILKTLYNGKRIPLIPPILVNNKLIPNFKKKANHFNAFFASQCTPVSNDSAIPSTTNLFLIVVYHPFNLKTKIFLRLYVPLTIIKPMVMMIYL